MVLLPGFLNGMLSDGVQAWRTMEAVCYDLWNISCRAKVLVPNAWIFSFVNFCLHKGRLRPCQLYYVSLSEAVQQEMSGQYLRRHLCSASVHHGLRLSVYDHRPPQKDIARDQTRISKKRNNRPNTRAIGNFEAVKTKKDYVTVNEDKKKADVLEKVELVAMTGLHSIWKAAMDLIHIL